MTARPTHAGHETGTAADAEDCAARIRRIFEDDLLAPAGVLHVASAWQDAEGRLFAMRIGPATPRSATDAFVLGVARARCDAIVTTGRILREEPAVRHALPPGLAAWRVRLPGRRPAPLSVVLTARDDLDLAHPLLSGRALVVTSRAAAQALVARARAAGREEDLEVVARPAPGLRDLLALLRDERGLTNVCVEAGPATAASLYEASPCVDELLLSIHLGRSLPAGVKGGALPGPEALARAFDARPSPLAGDAEAPSADAALSRFRVEEPSGPWLFCRFRRRALTLPSR